MASAAFQTMSLSPALPPPPPPREPRVPRPLSVLAAPPCVCARVRVCVCACARACVRACVRRSPKRITRHQLFADCRMIWRILDSSAQYACMCMWNAHMCTPAETHFPSHEGHPPRHLGRGWRTEPREPGCQQLRGDKKGQAKQRGNPHASKSNNHPRARVHKGTAHTQFGFATSDSARPISFSALADGG